MREQCREMSYDFTSLGYRIRSLRKERHLTTKELSELCGISDVYLRQIEGQGKVPKMDIFVSLCNVLNTTPTYLLQDCLDFSCEDDNEQLILQCRKLSPGEQVKASALLELVFGDKDLADAIQGEQ